LADSYITKKALANALKELMADIPFAKINISHICDKCQMNRKSFYYHFRDKYDLINWIFDTEFLQTLPHGKIITHWELICGLCDYFYREQAFYRKVFKIKGQNSFCEYFQSILTPILERELATRSPDRAATPFCVHFYVDAFICTFDRWLSDKEPDTPARFTEKLRTCLAIM